MLKNNLKTKLGLVTNYDVNGEIESILVRYDKNKKKYSINWEIFKGLFEELVWTEKHTWKNINRDKLLNQHNLEPDEMEKLAWSKEEEKKEQ